MDEYEVAAELADEVRLMAGWLDLDRVAVHSQGNLASTLSRAVNFGHHTA